MLDVVGRFGGTVERRSILAGLLEYRQGLRAAGILTGFQWLNGSFVEDIEAQEGRPPHDVDVVTFAALGDPTLQEKRKKDHPALFDQNHRSICKQTYQVDGYWMDLSSSARLMVMRSTYWYSMWSHRRGGGLWKGFLQVELDETQGLDEQADELLKASAAPTRDGD